MQTGGRTIAMAAGLMALAALCGCNKPGDAATVETQPGHGRYAGVGVVDAGRNWSSGIVANRPDHDPQAALTAHDDHIIVVVDTTTGAIKQCGDVSGYCIGERNLDPVGPTRTVKPFTVLAGYADVAASDGAGASDAAASSN